MRPQPRGRRGQTWARLAAPFVVSSRLRDAEHVGAVGTAAGRREVGSGAGGEEDSAEGGRVEGLAGIAGAYANCLTKSWLDRRDLVPRRRRAKSTGVSSQKVRFGGPK